MSYGKIPPSQGSQPAWIPSQSPSEMRDFQEGSQPISGTLAVPEMISNPDKASETLTSSIAINLEQSPNPENLQKREGLAHNMKKLGSFVENHPILTAGCVAAFFLVVASAYFTIQALLGHTTISIFHAHPAIGGGITFMAIYHSVSLINLCRRASLKDDLEALIEANSEINRKLVEQEGAEIPELKKRIQTQMEELESKFQEAATSIGTMRKQVQEKYQAALKTQQQINLYQKQLWQLQSQSSALSDISKSRLKTVYDKATIVAHGATLALPAFDETLIPQLPQLDPEEAVITIPLLMTDAQREREFSKQAFLDKVKILFQGLRTWMEENPRSVALFVGGLAMCALSGLAIYYYLHGTTSLYFFGSLSLSTLAPMLVYGLGLIYQSYNSIMIKELKNRLRDISDNQQDIENAIEQNREQLKKMRDKTATAFETFVQQWTEYQSVEILRLQQETRILEQKTRDWNVTSALCAHELEFLRHEVRAATATQAVQILQRMSHGSQLAGSFTQ